MKRMSILVLATLTLAGCGGGNMPFATPHDTENTASGPNSNVVAPAGATFFDDFSKGSLDTSKWMFHLETDAKDPNCAMQHFVADGKLDNIGSYNRTVTGTYTYGTTKGDFKITRD